MDRNMEKEYILQKLEYDQIVNGLIIKGMVKLYNNIRMGINLLGNIMMDLKMDMDFIIMLMEPYTKEILLTGNTMEGVSLLTQMGNSILENGLKTSLMERVYINSQNMADLMDSFITGLRVGMVHITFQMEISILVNLRTIK